MTALRLARTELRRLTSGRLPVLALVAVTLVPLLYGALYIYANRDPHEQLGSVPAAVVVADTGATRSDGSSLHAGRTVYEHLRDSGTFDWHRVGPREAESGVAGGEFTFALVVPENFSEALLSPGRFDPRQARLRLITNDANNYLVGTIATRVADEVREAVADDAGTEAAKQLLLGLSTVHDRTVRAADGAERLTGGLDRLDGGIDSAADGATRLADGARRLVDGQRELIDGTTRLTNGTGELAAGAEQLHTGLRKLRDRTAQLPARADALADGAEKVAAGNRKLADRADELGELSRQLVDHSTGTRRRVIDNLRRTGVPPEVIDEVATGMRRADDPLTEINNRIRRKVDAVNRLSDGADRVADGARQLATAAPKITSAVGGLTDGAAELSTGAERVDRGAEQLHTGQQQALRGAKQLATGARELDNGTEQLDRGSDRLVDGARTLGDKLDEGARRIPNPDERTSTATARTISSPVAVDERAQASAGSYGAGLAPFFLGLALWIGAFVLFLLMRPLSQRALAAGTTAWRVALGGWLPAAAVGLAQTVLLYTAVVFGVGLQPARPLLTLGFLAVTSLAFTALVHSLNAAFGPRGKFVALVVLVLQLVTAGGTFPWQTIPDPLHPLHQVLPLSYVVDGLRHLLYGGPLDSVPRDLGVLACYLVAAVLLSSVAALRQRVWTPARVKPELSL